MVKCEGQDQSSLLSSGSVGSKQICIYHTGQLLVSSFLETRIIRANIYLLSTYNVPGIILHIL